MRCTTAADIFAKSAQRVCADTASIAQVKGSPRARTDTRTAAPTATLRLTTTWTAACGHRARPAPATAKKNVCLVTERLNRANLPLMGKEKNRLISCRLDSGAVNWAREPQTASPRHPGETRVLQEKCHAEEALIQWRSSLKRGDAALAEPEFWVMIEVCHPNAWLAAGVPSGQSLSLLSLQKMQMYECVTLS